MIGPIDPRSRTKPSPDPDATAARAHEAPNQPTERIHRLVVEAPSMETEPSRVIVTLSATSSAACVHHRDFPEIRAEGSAPKEAAAHLVNQLTRALDTALTDWRRD